LLLHFNLLRTNRPVGQPLAYNRLQGFVSAQDRKQPCAGGVVSADADVIIRRRGIGAGCVFKNPSLSVIVYIPTPPRQQRIVQALWCVERSAIGVVAIIGLSV
jgi:hypothetical protein